MASLTMTWWWAGTDTGESNKWRKGPSIWQETCTTSINMKHKVAALASLTMMQAARQPARCCCPHSAHPRWVHSLYSMFTPRSPRSPLNDAEQGILRVNRLYFMMNADKSRDTWGQEQQLEFCSGYHVHRETWRPKCYRITLMIMKCQTWIMKCQTWA